jgi:hypothetical protein
MVERTRAHERIPSRDVAPIPVEIPGLLPRAIDLFVPPGVRTGAAAPLVVHFLGAAHVPLEGVMRLKTPAILGVVNIAPGTSAYERPFLQRDAWPRVLSSIDSALARAGARRGSIYLTAFSAGHGAVRAILADDRAARDIRGVLLLDGLHTSYVPERRVLAEGGTLDTTKLAAILAYARRAVAGEARLVITHSEVFPGTFASTTETANWLLDALGLRRTAVLEWGPVGMQQTSVVTRGGFTMLGFAGNSAPDHLDHLHALPWLLPQLLSGFR